MLSVSLFASGRSGSIPSEVLLVERVLPTPVSMSGGGFVGGAGASHEQIDLSQLDLDERLQMIQTAVASNNIDLIRTNIHSVRQCIYRKFHARRATTLLHLARSKEMVEILLSLGASTIATNHAGRTPLAEAIANFPTEEVSLPLRSNFADSDGHVMVLADPPGDLVVDFSEPEPTFRRRPHDPDEVERHAGIIRALAVAEFEQENCGACCGRCSQGTYLVAAMRKRDAMLRLSSQPGVHKAINEAYASL